MTQLMFGAFNTPKILIADQGLLALYASGRTTGLVVSSGEGVTFTVPVVEGFSFPHAMERYQTGGHDITKHMRRLLQERGYYLPGDANWEILRDMKERLA